MSALASRRLSVLALGTLALLISALAIVLRVGPGGDLSQETRGGDSADAPSPARTVDVAPAAVEAGASDDWWQAVAAKMAGEEYHAAEAGGGLQAPNRAQNLRTRFGAQGIAIEPRMPGDAACDAARNWRFGWTTAAIGRPGQMEAAAPAQPQAHGARVTYERPGWREWYENSPAGIEQGFTIERRPPGAGPLVIAGTLAGGLRAELVDGEVDVFDAHGVRVLRYGKLLVEDASGDEVPSRLALAGDALAIEIEDRDATYPLLVDPLMTSPSWTAEGNQPTTDFGATLTTAGDVNGDGESDVIVGAALYDNGEIDEGKVFLYLGTGTGLAASPAWTAEGNQPEARFGRGVATAGDVNGDRYADVIIGAWLHDNGQENEGRVHVYHGSPAGLGASPAWTAEGNQDFAFFGISVATAGDVNRDGYSDVVIGAPNFVNGQPEEGRAFVYHGSPAGLAASPAWTRDGQQSGASYGIAVAGAGDVNGDGYADVIVGADLYDDGQADEGRAFVYHGSPAGLQTVVAWFTEPNQHFANLGRSVAGAGDVNGDGFADVIVGCPSFDDPLIQEGLVLVFHGSPSGLDFEPFWTAQGDQSLAIFGTSVATAGDVNGDGYSDIMVGAPGWDNDQISEGRAFVYYGSTGGLGGPGWIAEGNQADANFGSAVATAGDVSGDGFSDVVIGATFYENGHLDEGRAVVYYGTPAGLSPTHSWITNGGQANAGWGWVVAAAGDVDGDGYSDVIAVADRFDSGEADEGKAWLYHGSATGLRITPSASVETNQVAAEMASAASAGDVNGDGYSDVIIGTYRYDNGQSDEGRALVYAGSAGGLHLAPIWIAESNQASAWFGSSVACAGDVNGDGFSDVIVGSDGWDNGQTSEGRAWLYLGTSSGLPPQPAWVIESNQDGGYLGYSVAGAGDVNRDGYSDVLVALPVYDLGQVDEGVVWVFHGSATGLGPAPARVLEVDQPGASFGSRVATAGDVNGDGYADAIIGADHFDGGQIDEGRAFVFHGGASGLAGVAAWTTEPDQASALLGYWVSPAGDVNNDGYSEVFVGAPFYDNGSLNEGGAWLYQGSPAGLGAPVWAVEGNQGGAVLRSGGGIGDVNGDGFGEVAVGAPGYTGLANGDGRVWVYYGGIEAGTGLALGARAGGAGGGAGEAASELLLDRAPQQLLSDRSAPIQLLGASDSQTSFQLQARGRTSGGRGTVRLQWEVKPASVPFDGLGLGTGPAFDTGAPTFNGSSVVIWQLVSGLQPSTVYKWRMRVLSDSPFFPHSPWLSLPGNGASEPDFRTAPGVASAETQSSPDVAARLLEPAAPNPFTTETRFQYQVPAAGRTQLAVYDAQGRCVREIADRTEQPGRYAAIWDGRNAGGQALPNGVYFIRLALAGRPVAAQKVVITR